MGLLAALDRFNATHPWSHNDAFAWFVLKHARAVRRCGGDSVLEVGCGTGNILARLAKVFPQVMGVEPDHASAATAAERFKNSRTVRIDQRRFGKEPARRYDLIVFVASLHQMPVREVLHEAREALRPKGRIVIVGLAKDAPGDGLRSLVSLILNPIIGFLRNPTPADQHPAHMQARTVPATDSFDDLRTVMQELLPGVRMRRRLFWRYTAAWTSPD